MVALSIGVTLVTLKANAWTASGADASGYVSEADLWRHGALTVPQPLATGAPWTEPEWTLSPLGYRPAQIPAAIVPTYPAGLPLTLAAAQLVGGRDAAYVVVPIVAGLGVWFTFLLGRRSGGPLVGVIAATLLAVSPIYLRQSTQVMSDVPAAAWWTLALVLAQQASRQRQGQPQRQLSAGRAIGAGFAASLAVATRPNLSSLAAAIAAVIALAPRTGWRDRATGLVAFGLGLAPGCLLIALVHTHLYGSPLRSGYGSNADLYALANIPENARLYAGWLVEGQTPMLLLAFGAVLARRRGARSGVATASSTSSAQPLTSEPDEPPPLWPLWSMVALVVASYLPYGVFEAWWYIRFLLPAFPAAFVLVALCLVGVAQRLPARIGDSALVIATIALVVMSVVRGRTLHTLDLARDERRYVQMTDALTTFVPAASAFISMQHSGSVHHYLDRPILRWELLPPERLDSAIDYLAAKGYRPYILLDSWEAPRFRARFADASVIGRLDWPPILELRSPTPVRLFDPGDRARYVAGERIPTKLVFPPRR